MLAVAAAALQQGARQLERTLPAAAAVVVASAAAM
jgi:hypothetical protein